MKNFVIDIGRDGDQISALLGTNMMQGFCGFGKDLRSALGDLMNDLDNPKANETAEAQDLRREINSL